MKKLLAALLLVVMLAQVLPLEAFATVGKVLTPEELARAYALTGLGEGEAVYHNGMTPNASWNAAELSDWIEDKLDNEMYNIGDILSRAQYALGELKENNPGRYEEFERYGTVEGVEKLYAEAEALREEMRWYKDQMDACSGVIAEMKHALETEDSALFDSDKVRYSARIEKAVSELTTARQELEERFPDWETQMDALRRRLTVGPGGDSDDSEDSPFVGDPLYQLFRDDAPAPVTNSAPVAVVNGANTRLSRLQQSAGMAANDTGVDAHITVITDQQICFSLVTSQNGRKTPVQGVEIRIKDILNSNAPEMGYYTNEDGLLTLPTNDFTTDLFEVIHLSLKVNGEAKGYRNFAVDDLDLELGEIYNLTMVPLDGAASNAAGEATPNAGKTPYIVSGEFGGRDIMNSDYEMVYSTVNDYAFDIKVEVANAEGYPDLVMIWYENDGSFSKLKKNVTKATSHVGNVYTFRDSWKRKLSPNASKDQRPTFAFGTADDAVKYTSRLVSKRSATDKPLNEGTGANGGVFGNVLGKGFDFGVNIPLGSDKSKSIRIGLNLPFTQYLPKLNIDPGGYVTMSLGSDIFSDKIKKVKANWQSQDLKEFKRAQTYVQKESAFGNYKAQYDLAYEFYKEKKFKFLGEASLQVGLFGVATGRWQLDDADPDVKTKLITARLGFGATVTFSYSWTISYPVGPVPVYVSFTLGVSAGFGAEMDFNFCWVNGGFQNWKIQYLKDITIDIGFLFSAQLGVGIKGFLEAYVRFTASLDFLIRLYIDSSEPSGLEITYGASLTVGVTVFFVSAKFNWKLAGGTLYKNGVPNGTLLDYYMNAGTPEVVKAAHQEPLDYPDLAVSATALQDAMPADTPNETKIVTIEGDTWLFYLAKESSGDMRLHWKNLRTGKEQSIEDALAQLRQYSAYEYIAQTSGTSDYAFDAWYGDQMLVILRCFAESFDSDGYPRGPACDMLVLERQDDGTFEPIFKKARMEAVVYGNQIQRRSLFVRGQFMAGYAPMTHPSIDDIRLVWGEYDPSVLRGLRMRGLMETAANPDNGDAAGVVFFVYNNIRDWEDDVPNRYLILHTDQYIGSHEGYKRVQYLSPVRPMEKDDWYWGAGVYAFKVGAQEFIALNRSETDSADAFIELYDRQINSTSDARGLTVASLMKGIRIAEGDIRHMALLPTGEDGVTHLLYTQAEKSADGAEQLRLHGLRIQPPREIKYQHMEVDVTQYDYDTVVNAERFEVGYIGETPYLYWYSAVPKGEDSDTAVWRVWAAAYDTASDTVAAPSVFAQFELPKLKVQVGVTDIMKWGIHHYFPIYKDVSALPTSIELTASGMGYMVAAAEEVIEGENLPRIGMYSFPERLKPVANLQNAIPQDMAIKAGDFEDIDLGVMNSGNLALATFDVELREVDDSGREGSVVETAHVNLYEPEKSKVTLADGKTVMSGRQAAYRLEDFDYSPRQRDFVTAQESRTYEVSMEYGVSAEVTVTASDTQHLSSRVLMPGSLGAFRAAFKIPETWKGKKNLRLRVNRVSVESNWLRLMANASGLAYNAVGDGNDSMELVYVLNPDTGKLELQMPAEANGAVSNAVMNAVRSGIIANEVDAGDAVDIVTEVQDIQVSHRVYEGWDGQDWLDIVIRNHAATDDALKLTCAVYVDGSDEPNYVNLPYYQQATSNRRTHTISLPVSALVNDASLHRQARVVISALDYDERAYANNEFTVNLEGTDPLRFTRQPEDVVVQEGGTATFSVEVAGGVKPYTYQWQVFNPKTGQWEDLKGFTDPTISREDIEAKWSGAKFRCVVTDAAGTQIISREVTLTVQGIVDTGDHANLPLYLAVALIAIALLALTRRKRAN